MVNAVMEYICMMQNISTILPIYYTRSLQLSEHLVALLHEDGSLIDQLVNDSLGRLLLVDHSGCLTH